MFKYSYSFFLILFLVLFFFFSKNSLAQTELTVTIRVGVTNLTLSGRSSPQSQITIMENNAVIGTTTADDDGLFSKTLESMEVGLHSISIFATDKNNQTTSTVVYSISLLAGTETTLSNIILPSTVVLSDEEIIQGEALIISGYAVPSSIITIFFTKDSKTSTKTANANNNGYWQYSLTAINQEVGNYQLYVRTSTTDGYQSEKSKTMSFKIQTASTPTPTPTPAETTDAALTPTPTTTPQVTPIPTPSLPSFLRVFDLDNSGKIELREIFGMVKHWVLSWRNPESDDCDLNQDGVCNLIDFSVLMYYVER